MESKTEQNTYTCIYRYADMYAYARACIYIHIHSYIYIHTHMSYLSPSLRPQAYILELGVKGHNP